MTSKNELKNWYRIYVVICFSRDYKEKSEVPGISTPAV